MDASWTVSLAFALFLGMTLSLELGYRIGRRDGQDQATPHQGVGALEAAIFALLGLLLGFAFVSAISRLDARRTLIVDEANAIGTAYLRIDLLPVASQPDIRALFREYLEARLRVYEKISDRDEIDRRIAVAAQLQRRIWAHALAAAPQDPTRDTRVVVPALNQMIDITTARTVALRTRLPTLILVLLIAVAILSALMGGYAMAERGKRSPLHITLYSVAVTVTIYAVLDLDNPRFGLIRLDAAERVLRELHDSIR